ncbi:MAG: VCBS repeat-containing protein, partial [Thermoplasmata archaeon]|nr:VCBS repeat-containing protein [Thermoplasmata archaeon]
INDQNGGFTLTNSYDVGTHPREFTIADIDGDGDMDIISADLLDDTITVYENLGLGSFTKRDTYKTDPGPRSITAGDIDGDNDIDLITANRHSDTISILFNSNSIPGNYSSRIEYDCGETPIKVVVGDVDMDGDTDIACVNLHDNNVQIFNNSGKGNFPSSFLIYTHPGPYHVEILDMDNDADNDIVISSAYKDKLLTVFRDRPPRIEFIEPDGFDDLADLEYTIKWFGHDPDKHNILAVDLFYNVRLGDDKAGETRGAGDDEPRKEPDPSTGGGVVYGMPIVFGTENDGEYVWDCSEVPNGSYQLAAIISDDYGNYFSASSEYNVTITHNVPPKLIILNPPDGELIYAHTSFTIRWADSDPDDNAIINISYDNDNNSANGNSGRLVSDRSEDKDGDNDKYKWKTSAVPPGEYYIVFEITDGHRDTMVNYSDGKVWVNHDPKFFKKPDITIL